jgi:SHS2 domain-containing protein
MKEPFFYVRTGFTINDKKQMREAIKALTQHVIEREEQDNISVALIKTRKPR